MLSPSLLAFGALFMCAFGVVVWLFDRRRGDRASGPVVVTGPPGVYRRLPVRLGFYRRPWLALPARTCPDLPGGILLGVSYLIQVMRVHRRPPGAHGMADGPPGVLTGVQLTAPAPGSQLRSASGIRRWSGPASLPSALGQVSVLLPLARLTVSGSRVSLRLRPRLLEKLLAVKPLSLTPANAAQVFPVSGARTSKGTGILAADGWYYLGTPAREEVLATLSAAGVNVSWTERQAPPRTG